MLTVHNKPALLTVHTTHGGSDKKRQRRKMRAIFYI